MKNKFVYMTVVYLIAFVCLLFPNKMNLFLNESFAGFENLPAPEAVDYGFRENEQSGGGGLIGGTVRMLNGNVIDYRQDFSYNSPNSMGFSFKAVYNSKSDRLGATGFGWTHNFEVTLDQYSEDETNYIKLIDETGRTLYFKESTTGFYQPLFYDHSYVKAEAGGYVWYCIDGKRYGFGSDEKLAWIDDAKGNRISLAQDKYGRIERVTDNASGRSFAFLYNSKGLITQIWGPDIAETGCVWAIFVYDSNNNLISADNYPYKTGMIYEYSKTGDIHNLTAKRNKAGHLLKTFTYDTLDRCTSYFSRNGDGASLISYDSATQVKVTDAYSKIRVYTLGINPLTLRKYVTAMQGSPLPPYTDLNVQKWMYDSNMNLTEITTGRGIIHSYSNYDSRGNPGTVTLEAGTAIERKIDYTYHPETGVPLSRTELSTLGTGNKVTIWDYDADSNTTPNEAPTKILSRIIERGYTYNTDMQAVPYEYITAVASNAKGQITSIDGPIPGNADLRTFTYDAATGNILSDKKPLIGTASYSGYDHIGRLSYFYDANGQGEKYGYGASSSGMKRSINHMTADNTVISIAFNNAGLLYQKKDEDNVTSTYLYDPVYGRLSQINDMDGNSIIYSYDNQGNRTGIDKASVTTENTYSRKWDFQHPTYPGMLWKEIRPDMSFSEYNYNAEGSVSSFKDFEGNVTFYDYDAFGRMKKSTQPGDVITTYIYDEHGNLKSVTDAEGHVTSYVYDDMGRMLKVVSPDSGTVVYAYDEAGNLIRKKDSKNITVAYTYDALNRPLTVAFPDPSENITYTYDEGTNAKGFLTTVTDKSGLTKLAYDNRGRLVTKNSTIGSATMNLAREFTPGSRIKSMTYPSTATLNYKRDVFQRVSEMNLVYGSRITTLVEGIAYRPFAGPKSMHFSGSESTGTSSSACECIETVNPGAPMEQKYAYDKNRNLLSIKATNPDEAGAYDRTYTYDAIGNLKTAAIPAAAGTEVSGDYGFTYDKVDNRQSCTVNGQTGNYAYTSGTNMLAGVSATNGSASCTHDANGNTVSVGEWAYVFNQSNQISQVKFGEDQTPWAEYTYNAFGQRASKKVHDKTTLFIYDFDGNIVYERTIEEPYSAREYFYMGANRLAMSDVYNSSTYFYHNDRLGTPLYMTDPKSGGAAVWEAAYTPFGDAYIKTSVVQNNFRFPGQYFDSETGLHYNYHRYYDPKTGRYLTPDPIGLAGGINPFAYCGNNPVNGMDPFGLIRWGQLGSSVLGLAGNGLGVVAGSMLLGAPDPTMTTKIVGGGVLGKSLAGWGLNWYNFAQSISQPCDNYDAPSSATRAIATVVAPGNQDAQRLADVADLSIDFMSGRGAIYPYGTPILAETKGVTTLYDPASHLLTNPSTVSAFQGTQVIVIGIDNATR